MSRILDWNFDLRVFRRSRKISVRGNVNEQRSPRSPPKWHEVVLVNSIDGWTSSVVFVSRNYSLEAYTEWKRAKRLQDQRAQLRPRVSVWPGLSSVFFLFVFLGDQSHLDAICIKRNSYAFLFHCTGDRKRITASEPRGQRSQRRRVQHVLGR